MDPDSPFAHLGKIDASDGLRDIGTMLCHQCKHEWTVPIANGRARQTGPCQRCGSVRLALKDGSVRRETAPRV